MASGEVNKKTFMRLVDLMLKQGGVPREYLFEYPYNEYESDRLTAEAERSAEAVLKVLGLKKKL